MPDAAARPAGLSSSAPHFTEASRRIDDLADWGPQPDAIEGVSRSSGRLLWKGSKSRPEVGLWVCTPGRWRLSLPSDEICHFVAGRATYRGDDNGEIIEVAAGTVVHFRKGWTGECEVHETMRNLYMLA